MRAKCRSPVVSGREMIEDLDLEGEMGMTVESEVRAERKKRKRERKIGDR